MTKLAHIPEEMLLRIINEWWDEKLNAGCIDVADEHGQAIRSVIMFEFSEQLRDIFETTELRFSYDMKTGTWYLKPITNNA